MREPLTEQDVLGLAEYAGLALREDELPQMTVELNDLVTGLDALLDRFDAGTGVAGAVGVGAPCASVEGGADER